MIDKNGKKKKPLQHKVKQINRGASSSLEVVEKTGKVVLHLQTVATTTNAQPGGPDKFAAMDHPGQRRSNGDQHFENSEHF